MDLQYRLYQEGDEKGIIELLDKVFGKWPNIKINCSMIDHWRWKYLDNPVSSVFISLCFDEGKLVGCFHAWPMRVKLGTNFYLAATGTDLAVDPEYRRMGIYGNMKKILFDAEDKMDIKFHFGVSGNPILIDHSKREGYRYFPYETHKFVKIFDMDEHVKHWDNLTSMKIFGYKTFDLLNRVKHKATRKKIQKSNDIYVIDKFDENINSFFNQIKDGYDFIVERKTPYMNYRYCSGKSNEYKIFAAGKSGEFKGYIIAAIDENKPDYPVGYIVDLLNTPNSKEAPYQLLDSAINYLYEQGTNMIVWQINLGSNYTKVAEYHGLLDSRNQAYFNYQPWDKILPEDEKILLSGQKNRIHFSYGDYDPI